MQFSAMPKALVLNSLTYGLSQTKVESAAARHALVAQTAKKLFG
jgi:hypothetical protein